MGHVDDDGIEVLSAESRGFAGRLAEIRDDSGLTGYLLVSSVVLTFSSGGPWRRRRTRPKEFLRWNVVRVDGHEPIEYLEGEYDDEATGLAELRSGTFSIWGEQGTLRWLDDDQAAEKRRAYFDESS